MTKIFRKKNRKNSSSKHMIPIPAYNSETNKMETFNLKLVIEPVFTDQCCLHMYNS